MGGRSCPARTAYKAEGPSKLDGFDLSRSDLLADLVRTDGPIAWRSGMHAEFHCPAARFHANSFRMSGLLSSWERNSEG